MFVKLGFSCSSHYSLLKNYKTSKVIKSYLPMVAMFFTLTRMQLGKYQNISQLFVNRDRDNLSLV